MSNFLKYAPFSVENDTDLFPLVARDFLDDFESQRRFCRGKFVWNWVDVAELTTTYVFQKKEILYII